MKDEDQRSLSVHECGFRVACGSYVEPIRECARKMVWADQVGFLDATMRSIYGADEALHDFGEGKRRGGGFSSDMIRAFPSLHHPYIRRFFDHTNATGWISIFFFRIFSGITHYVCFRGVIRKGARSYRGLLQGNPLAAYFFIILFQPLLELLRPHLAKSERMFAYADDLIVMLKSIWRLVKLLPLYVLFGKASGCRVHLGKSGWVYSAPPTAREVYWWHDLPEVMRSEGQKLALVAPIKYLGIIIGKWVTAEERLRAPHMKAMDALRGLSDRKSLSCTERLLVLNIFIFLIYGYVLMFTSWHVLVF